MFICSLMFLFIWFFESYFFIYLKWNYVNTFFLVVITIKGERKLYWYRYVGGSYIYHNKTIFKWLRIINFTKKLVSNGRIMWKSLFQVVIFSGKVRERTYLCYMIHINIENKKGWGASVLDRWREGTLWLSVLKGRIAEENYSG